MSNSQPALQIMGDAAPREPYTTMQAANSEFDTGSLSLVKREIEIALARADEGITAFAADPEKLDLNKTTLPHLHQVTGVLRMVGLEPASKVLAAVEKLVELLASRDLDPVNETINTVRNSIKALIQYLEDLARGEPNRPLSLFPAYRTVQALTGDGKVIETDLFYPDLSKSPIFTESTARPTDADAAKLTATKRTEFQRALLELLRSTDFQKSFKAMSNALAAIEMVSPAEKRVLWWIAVGFLEGLANSPSPPDVFCKQQCGRIDQQIKRQLDGATTTPEGLLRELLFSIAYMPPLTQRVQDIQNTYQLKNLLPQAGSADTTRTTLFLRDVREQIDAAKDTWANLAMGNKSSASQFHQQTDQLNELGKSFTSKALQTVFTRLAEVGKELAANPRNPGDTLALETATALLIVRDALDTYPQLSTDVEHLAEISAARVIAALKGQPLPNDGAQRLSEISWIAGKKPLLAHLGQEIGANLNRIEEVLDNFFRDPSKRPELEKAIAFIKEIHGVLAMLEIEEAVKLLSMGNQLVQKFAAGDKPPEPKDTEFTAEVFSNLGVFVSALQQGQENPAQTLRSLLSRLRAISV